MPAPLDHLPGDARPTQTLPVIEEQLEVARRTVDTGRVRIRKRVHEEAVAVDETRVTETVDTERVPIGRVLAGPVGVRQEGDVTIVPVVEERLVVRKELVLVEELRITRRRQSRPERQQVSLRREEVIVERLDLATGQWRSDEDGDAAVSGPDPPAG